MPEYIPKEEPVSEIRRRLADHVTETAVSGEITYLTLRGRRVAALVPVRVADDAVRQRNQDGNPPHP
jgi:hypothetical protein